MRGGAFAYRAADVRSALRLVSRPANRISYVCLRVARTYDRRQPNDPRLKAGGFARGPGLGPGCLTLASTQARYPPDACRTDQLRMYC